MTLPSTKTYQYLLITTIFFGFLVLFWGLGSLQLMSLNEGRRALAIKEMFTAGSWLLPTQNGELYLTKPPLLYWCSLVISALIGQVNEWTLRLPSAIAAASVALMTYFYTKKHFGALAALFAIQLLMANVAFVMLARRVEIEMLLTALCFGALLSAIRYIDNKTNHYWIYLSYGLLALAVLTKGPVAMLFVTAPLLVIAVWTKNQQVKEVLTDKIGWLIFTVIALSWYVAVTVELGPNIWAAIVKHDMLNKIQADDLAKPLLSYIAWIATDFLLIIVLFLYQPKRLWAAHKNKPGFLVLVAACVLPIIIFSIFSNKHAKYLLPIYPVIVILLTIQVSQIFELSTVKFKCLILILGMLLVIIFVGFYMFFESKVFEYRVSVFPQFQSWSKTVPVKQIYAFEAIDTRVIYYAEKPIKIISLKAVLQLKAAKQSALVLSEEKYRDNVAKNSDCQIKVFEPYLKKNKKLFVYGFGSLCTN